MTVYVREKKLILMSTRNSTPVNVINTMCEADCKGDLELYVINMSKEYLEPQLKIYGGALAVNYFRKKAPS